MSRRALPLLIAALALALATTACQVTLSAGIDVGRDGSGRVTAGVGLDAAALTELGDPATALRVDDLRQAGWQVEAPRREDDGLTWVRASKPFTDPEHAAAVLAELNGPEGPFRDFRVVRTKSLTRSRTTFTGTLDLSRGLVGLSDPELAAALGDVDLGLDLEGLRQRFGDELARTVRVQVTAGLPGKIVTNAPARDGGRALWAPELGETVPLEASSEALRIDPVIPIAAGSALVMLLLIVVLAVRRRRARR
jgi:hypothetical protein